MTAKPLRDDQSPFRPATLFWGIFASLFAAAGFFLLSTYAPDFRPTATQGPTPLSKSGVGYAGLVKWLGLAGYGPSMATIEGDLDAPSLMIVTIAPQSDREALDRILEGRTQPTLFVMPKWQTTPFTAHDGWDMKIGRLPSPIVDGWLEQVAHMHLGVGASPVRTLDVDGRIVASPEDLQWVESDQPLIKAGLDSRAVLIRRGDKPFYVLTDPDLLNNAGLADPKTAAAALALLDFIRPDNAAVVFDLTLHGAGGRYDLAKLLVEPPFLALTLTILIAAGLALLQGLARFGPPRAEVRAIALGKRALVDSTAMLLKRAGRLEQLGGRYAALTRSRAAASLGAPAGLQGEALDRWLDLRDNREANAFSTRYHAVAKAKTLPHLNEAARRLHDWIARRLGERG